MQDCNHEPPALPASPARSTCPLHPAFFEKLSGGDDEEGGEIVLKGKSEVLKYLLEKGFAQLKVSRCARALTLTRAHLLIYT